MNQAELFASGTNSISGSTPYRFDMWAINDPHVALSQGQAASIPTTNVAYYIGSARMAQIGPNMSGTIGLDFEPVKGPGVIDTHNMAALRISGVTGTVLK